MSLPEIVSRDEWLAARTALLEQEKAMTRERDKLSAERRRAADGRDRPRTTAFNGPGARSACVDLFEGRHQLIVCHFMFHPDWEDGCPSCSAGADEVADGLLEHLHVRDTTLAYVSRAPLEKIERYRAKKGWTFPWYSSNGSDFNYDFDVTLDGRVAPLEYNYRTPEEYEATARRVVEDGAAVRVPGTSGFLRVDDDVFHTYSSFARGAEPIGGSYYLLDLTALGRQEEWEKPKGRSESARAAQPDFAS